MEKDSYKKRCMDCACLIKKGKNWCCDECFGQPIENIDDCPEGITLDIIEKANEKAKQVKNVVSSVERKTKKRKPRERKLDEEKVNLIAKIYQFLLENSLENVEIIKKEREIDFSIGENDYTLTLIKHRKAKK